MLSVRLAAACWCAALLVPHMAADAAPKPRQSIKNYIAPAGLTNAYPQNYIEQDSDDSSAANADGETIGGGTSAARKTENRVMVKAQDVTGRPVALTLYWFDHPTKPNRTAVVCGSTQRPLSVNPGSAVYALPTAGEGCPGTVSAPTRGKITFTWSYQKPVKRKQ